MLKCVNGVSYNGDWVDNKKDGEGSCGEKV